MARRRKSGGCLSSFLSIFFIIFIISQIATIPDNYKIVIGQAIIIFLIAVVIYFVIKIIRNRINKGKLNNYYKYKQEIENKEDDEYNFDKIIIKSTKELKQKENINKIKNKIPVEQVPIISINKNYQLPNLEDFISDDKIVKILKKSDELVIPFYNNKNLELIRLSELSNLFIYGIQESGKSSLVHSIIDTILLTQKPTDIKFIIIDTKKLEHTNYNGIPHLLCPVVSDLKKASIALQNVVKEMEHRYDMFSNERAKNISEYNEIMSQRKKNSPDDETIQLMPDILLVVDELNDLTIVDKDVTYTVEQIAKHAKTVGIHLMCVSSNIVQPAFNNILFSVLQSRLMFRAYNQIEYKRILGNNLKRDLDEYEFFLKNYNLKVNDYYKFYRYSSLTEENAIKYVCKQQTAQYDESITVAKSEESGSKFGSEVYARSDDEDPLMNEIIDFAVESGKISASLVQRRFRLGYDRAARIIDELEARGIIGPQNGSKPREVLVKLGNQGDE